MFATLLTLAMGAGAFDVASANTSVEEALRESTSSDNFTSYEDKNSRLNKSKLNISSKTSLIVSKDSSMSLSAEVERASFVDSGAMVSLGNGTLSPTLSGGEGEKVNLSASNETLSLSHSQQVKGTQNNLSGGEGEKANLSVGEVAVVGDSRTNAGEGNVTSAREGAGATHDVMQTSTPTDTLSVSGTSESLNINTQKASIYTLDKSDRQNKIAHKSDITSNEVGGRTLTADSHTFTSAQTGAGSDSTLAPIESGIVNRALPERAIGSIAFSTFSLSEAQDLKVLNDDMLSAYALGEALALNSESYGGELAYGSSDIQSVGELSLNNFGLSFGTDKVDSIEVLEYEPLTSFEYNIKADKEDTKLLTHIAKVLGDISGRKALSQKVNTILDKPDNRYNELYLPVNKVLVAKEGQTLSASLPAQNTSGLFRMAFKGVPTGFATRQVVNSGETVELIEGTFENLQYTGDGAAIYNSGTISSVISEFVNNTATGTGGAIYNAGTINSINSIFANNTAYQGGAIFNTGTISNLTGIFDSNSVTGNSNYTNGGAITNAGVLNIDNALFTNNTTGRYGGIFTTATGNTSISNSVFIGNTVDYDGIGTPDHGGLGGAVGVDNKLKLVNDKFIGNSVISDTGMTRGGALYGWLYSNISEITDASFIGNYTQSNSKLAGGGAIFLNSGNISAINNNDFVGNYAKSTSEKALGGAIYNIGTINDIHANFYDNYTLSENYGSGGGAIYNAGTINNITGIFKGNKAINNATSMSKWYSQGLDVGSLGGAIAVGGNAKITDSIFDSNASEGYSPIAGAIFSCGKTIIEDSILKNNTAKFGGALYNYGGADYLSIENSSIIGNIAEYGGGAIENYNSAQSIFKNTIFKDNSAVNYGGAIYLTGGSATIQDSIFIGNTAGSLGAALFVNSSPQIANIIANSSDTVFKNNKVGSNYDDIYNVGTINLNAASGKTISFGGTVTGTGTINVNKSGLSYTDLNDDFSTKTVNITQQGGDYIFYNTVSGQTMNLYNGADVQLRGIRQENGNPYTGRLDLTGFTSTGAGNSLNAATFTLKNVSLGTVTLNNDTNFGLSLNNSGVSDTISASSFTGSGKFLINYVDIHNGGGTNYSSVIADSVLKSHVGIATNYRVQDNYYKNNYSLSYNASTGTLSLTPKTGTYNLKGFLVKDTSGTVYTLDGDEHISQDATIGNMVGTTKTVNAGNYTISGIAYVSGVTVGSGQTLNINGGTWDGFYGSEYGLIYGAEGSKVRLDNVIVENSYSDLFGAVIRTSGEIESLTGIIRNNTSVSSGVVTGMSNTDVNIKSVRAEFDNNKASHGGVFSVGPQNKVNVYGGSKFVNNTAVNHGGTTYSIEATVNYTADNDDIIFKNNTAGSYGGAIYNTGTVNINATGGDVIFRDNSSSSQGGAIYNTGTLNINGTSEHKVIFDSNSVRGNSGGTSNGGIITNTGILTINYAEFENNKTGRYAGIFNTNKAEITNSIFRNNLVDYTSAYGSPDDALGAAIGTDANLKLVNDTFIGNRVIAQEGKARGGAVYGWRVSNTSEITNSIFENNYVQSNNDVAGGGAIFLNQGTIGAINNTDFTGNYAESTSSNAYGGAIYNTGTMGTISGDFTDNYAQSTNSRAYGGAIYNTGTMGDIYADFTGNYITTTNNTSAYNFGGAISLESSGSIGNITGNFVNNNVDTTGMAIGGAIALINSTNSITSITGDFINNYVKSSGSYAEGSAIYSAGNIGSIKGDFIGNQSSTSANEFAIGSVLIGGTTGSISGNFINNSAISPSERAMGSAIYNSGTISNLSGTFIGNYVQSTSGPALGGAIYNYSTSTIGITANANNTMFLDNKTITGATTTYNDIYNTGTLNLNAKSGKSINFGGGIESTGTININNGYNGSAKGGNYVFNNTVNATTMNLYNGAKVKLGGALQGMDISRLDQTLSLGGDKVLGDFISDGKINWADMTSAQRQIAINSVYSTATNSATISAIQEGSAPLYQGESLSYGSLILDTLNVDATGGNISTINNHVETNSLGTVTLGTNLGFGIDIDLTNATADFLTASTLNSTTNKIIINSVNTFGAGDTLKRVKIANNVLMNNIEVAASPTNASSSGVNHKYVYSTALDPDDGKYYGYLDMTYARIADAVLAEETVRNYTILADVVDANGYEVVQKNLNPSPDTISGLGGGAGVTVTIDGGATTKYGINGNGKKGFLVEEGQTLNLKNIGSYTTTKDSDGIITSMTVDKAFRNFSGGYFFSPWHKNGGYIYNAGEMSIEDVIFTDSTAYQTNGDVIYNAPTGHISKITGAFKNNNSYGSGAIKNGGFIDYISVIFEGNRDPLITLFDGDYASGTITVDTITDSQLVNNTTGSALIRSTGKGMIGTISDSIFANNTSTGDGSSLYGTVSEMSNVLFKGNTAKSGGGIFGAAHEMSNVDFINNRATNGGGAFRTSGWSELSGNINFIGNQAGTKGGAMYIASTDSTRNTEDSVVKLINNRAFSDTGDAYGGAIYKDGGSSYFWNLEITDNYAMSTAEDKGGYGGAIAGNGFIQLVDPIIRDNAASTQGGAIYNTGSMYIIAKDRDLEFVNNRVGDIVLNEDGTINTVNNAVYNDIYTTGENTALNAAAGRTITLNGTITGSGNGNIYINRGDYSYTYFDETGTKKTMKMSDAGLNQGTVIFNNDVNIDSTNTNSAIRVHGGKLINNGTINVQNITVTSGAVLDSATDNLRAKSAVWNNGTINLSGTGQTYSKYTANGSYGVLNLAGDLTVNYLMERQYVNLTGNSTLRLRGIETVDEDDNVNFTSGTLTLWGMNVDANGGTLDTVNSHVEDKNYLGSTVLDGDLRLSLDVDAENSTADYFESSSFSGSGKVIIDTVNIVAQGGLTDKVKIANNKLKDHIEMSQTYTPSRAWAVDGVDYKITGYSTDNTYGYLEVGFNRLPDAVHATQDDRTYKIFGDVVNSQGNEEIATNLGNLGGATSETAGEGAKLTIDGGEVTRYGIDMKGKSGITVQSGQTLVVKNIGSVVNSEGNAPSLEDYLSGDYTVGASYTGLNSNDGIIKNNANGTLTLENVVVYNNGKNSNNHTIYNNGGVIENITGTFINNGGTGSFSTIRQIGNSAINNITANFINNYSWDGGAIANSSSLGTTSMYIKNSNFISNYSNSQGGAVFGDGLTYIENSTFRNNYTSGIGGAIAIDRARNITVKDSIIDHNYSAGSGGAIYGAKIIDTDLISNVAKNNGGAMYAHGDIFAINDDVLLSDNKVNVESITRASDGTITVVDGSNYRYNDLYIVSWISLNAGTYTEDGQTLQRAITLNGSVEGTGELVMNDDSVVKGGKYNFNNEINNAKLISYTGTDIQLGSHLQSDGSTTYGHLNVANTYIAGDTKLSTINGRYDYKVSDLKDYSNKLGNLRLNNNANLYYSFDVDFANDKADYLEGDVSITHGNIIIDNVNLTVAPSGYDEIKIASKGLIDAFKQNDGYITYNDGSSNIRYAMLYKIVDEGTDDQQGVYLAPSFYRLPDAISSAVSDRIYTIRDDAVNSSGNEVIDRNLGLMGGGFGAKLVIDGGENRYGVDGNGKAGIVVGQNQELIIRNTGSVLNSDGQIATTQDYIDGDYTVHGSWTKFGTQTYESATHGTLYYNGDLTISDAVFSNINNSGYNIIGRGGGTLKEISNTDFISNKAKNIIRHNYGTVGNLTGLNFVNNTVTDNIIELQGATVGNVDVALVNNTANYLLSITGGKAESINAVMKGNVSNQGLFVGGNVKNINLDYQNNKGHAILVVGAVSDITANISNTGGGILKTMYSGSFANLSNSYAYGNSQDGGGLLMATDNNNALTIRDSSFIHNINKNSGNGATLFLENASAVTNIIADSGDTIFRDNYTGSYTRDENYVWSLDEGATARTRDVYNKGGVLNLNAGTYVEDGVTKQRSIIFDDAVNGANGIININKSGLTYSTLNDDYTRKTDNVITQTGGIYQFGDVVSGNTLNVYADGYLKLGHATHTLADDTYGSFNLNGFNTLGSGVVLDAQNDHADNIILGDVNLSSDLTYKIDVDLASGLADYIGATSVVSGNSTINIDNINFVGVSSGKGRMKVADTVLKDRIRLSSAYDSYTWEGEPGITYRLKGYSIEVDETDGKEYGYLVSSFNRIHDAVRCFSHN